MTQYKPTRVNVEEETGAVVICPEDEDSVFFFFENTYVFVRPHDVTSQKRLKRPKKIRHQMIENRFLKIKTGLDGFRKT